MLLYADSRPTIAQLGCCQRRSATNLIFSFSVVTRRCEVLVIADIYIIVVHGSWCRFFTVCVCVRHPQREFAFWCQTYSFVFDTVAESERDARKAELRLASGGNPLMLRSFLDEFFMQTHVHAFVRL